MDKLRVGIVNYLHAKPLIWGFLKGQHGDLFTPMTHAPSRIAELMAQGVLDVGLVPSIEIQRIPGMRVIPDLCVAARRERHCARLLLREPIGRVRRIAIDSNAQASVALLKILCRECYGIDPVMDVQHPQVERMMKDYEAALVVGEAALRADSNRYETVDLIEVWNRLAGLPFVFGLWAVAGNVELPELSFYFKNSLRYGLSSLDHLAREAAAELGLGSDEIQEHLEEDLSYVLGPEELAGLEEFFHRAHAYGMAPNPRPVPWWKD